MGKCFICGEEVPMDHACLNAQVHLRCEGKLADFARLRAENERLRAALEAVEWLRTGHGGARCPSCGYYFGELDHKRHSHDCPLAAALNDKP